MFASLASARSGKEDLRRQTLTGSFLYKQFWQERCYKRADFGYLQQRVWGMIIKEAVDFLPLLHSSSDTCQRLSSVRVGNSCVTPSHLRYY